MATFLDLYFGCWGSGARIKGNTVLIYILAVKGNTWSSIKCSALTVSDQPQLERLQSCFPHELMCWLREMKLVNTRLGGIRLTLSTSQSVGWNESTSCQQRWWMSMCLTKMGPSGYMRPREGLVFSALGWVGWRGQSMGWTGCQV